MSLADPVRGVRDDEAARSRWRWLAGLVVGAAGAIVLVAGVLGLVAWGFLAAALLARPGRRAAMAGLPIGFGVTVLVLLARAESACRPDECVGPDLGGWIGLGIACLAIGSLATLALVVRARAA
jgi:hypothetical protein